MKTTKPETGLAREISAKLKFNDNISFESNAYKSHISDVLNQVLQQEITMKLLTLIKEVWKIIFTISGKIKKYLYLTPFLKAEKKWKASIRRPEKTVWN